MAPGALCNESDMSSPMSGSDAVSFMTDSDASGVPVKSSNFTRRKNYLLHSKVGTQPRILRKSKGSWLRVEDDRGRWAVFDGSGGAAVSCIGQGDKRVHAAVRKQQNNGPTHACAADFVTKPAMDLAEWLVNSTGKRMGGAVFYNSGTLQSAAQLLSYHFF